MSNSLAQET